MRVVRIDAGAGIVATETEERTMTPGDVVLIPAGERHGYGAAPGADCTHLSIRTPGGIAFDR